MALSLQTISNIEALLLSRSHPVWGEFVPLAGVIAAVQEEKKLLIAEQTAARVRPAVPRDAPTQSSDISSLAQYVQPAIEPPQPPPDGA